MNNVECNDLEAETPDLFRYMWPIVKRSPENRRTRSDVHHACTTNTLKGLTAVAVNRLAMH